MTSPPNDNRVQPVKFGHVNIYLVKTDSGYILVDTGMPNKNEQIDEIFQKYAVDPKSVQLIILTHGHLDHVGSVAYAKETTGAKVLCQQSFAKDLAEGKIEPAVSQNFSGRIMNFMSGFLGSKIGGVKPDIIVDEIFDLSEFGLPGKVIHTPGHSPSSLSILLENGEALIGDLIREERPGEVGFGMFYEDKNTILESLHKLAALNPRVIYLSHGTKINQQTLVDFLETFR
jgi:glyoxylase-like metal-dependent hydrolase (beta-lactamase superfamily II)